MSKAPSKQSTDRINNLNIALMVISGLLAFAWPFYLFLIAYAFLGPLHYLTEISWLHDKKYYTGRSYDAIFLIVITVIYGSSLFITIPQFQVIVNVVIVALIGSIALTLTKNILWRIGFGVLGAAFAYFVPVSYNTFFLSVLIITIVHVYLFTGFFIAGGAIRSRSRTGYISLAVFVGVAAILLLYRPQPSVGVVDSYVLTQYTRFANLNVWLIRTLGLAGRGGQADPFEFSAGAIAVMRFIAFAYLYHYLNWFSKTKIIRWHEVSKARLSVVGGIWIAAIVLYAMDYDLGFKALFFLSALHVMLELPLDVRTVVGIGSEFGKRLKLTPAFSRREQGVVSPPEAA